MIFDPSGGIIFIEVVVARTVRGFVAVSGKVGVRADGFIFAVGSGIALGAAHLTIDHGCSVGARRGDSGPGYGGQSAVTIVVLINYTAVRISPGASPVIADFALGISGYGITCIIGRVAAGYRVDGDFFFDEFASIVVFTQSKQIRCVGNAFGEYCGAFHLAGCIVFIGGNELILCCLSQSMIGCILINSFAAVAGNMPLNAAT